MPLNWHTTRIRQKEINSMNRINPVVFPFRCSVLVIRLPRICLHSMNQRPSSVPDVEQALQGAAELQLFELNDEITRANFTNIVEPYLRDVRHVGVYDYLVICDETNNTPDIIDNNEFRADIFRACQVYQLSPDVRCY